MRIAVRLENIVKSFLIAFIVLIMWQVFPTVGLVEQSILPPITKVFKEFGVVLGNGSLYTHILVSVKRSVMGLGFAMVIGLPLGIVVGYFSKFAEYMLPVINFCRQIPALALFPVFLLFFGIGEVSKVSIVLWVSIWPLLVNTISGVSQVDPMLCKVAKSMGEKDMRILFNVVLPASIPSIMTGLRLSAASSIVALVSAEMVGAKSGLGFLIVNSQYNFQIPRMYVAILTIAVIGIITNLVLEKIQKRLVFWAV